jgi:hypothetical protein
MTDKWTLSRTPDSDPDALKQQIYVADGKLNLDVNSGAGVNATLAPRLSGRPIKKLSFTMALVSTTGQADGAAYLIVASAGGREQRVWMGPNEAKQPTLGYYLCGKITAPVRTVQARIRTISSASIPVTSTTSPLMSTTRPVGCGSPSAT